MKIRNGFVSNSSSSSFLIAFKGNPKTEIYKVFGIKPKSLGGKMFGPLLDFLANGEPYSEEKFLKDNWYDTPDAAIADGFKDELEFLQLAKKGWKIFQIQASSDDYDSPSSFFYEKTPDINTKTVKVR